MIAERFKVGDLLTWNSETGRVSGIFIEVRTIDVDYKGRTRYASEDDPQYERVPRPITSRCIKANRIQAWSGVANEFGFKVVKVIAAIEFVHDFADLGAGQGGYNEDHEFYGYRMPI